MKMIMMIKMWGLNPTLFLFFVKLTNRVCF
nr:MAG TPA: hypothetical protein [Bacteriophage sp.]